MSWSWWICTHCDFIGVDLITISSSIQCGATVAEWSKAHQFSVKPTCRGQGARPRYWILGAENLSKMCNYQYQCKNNTNVNLTMYLGKIKIYLKRDSLWYCNSCKYYRRVDVEILATRDFIVGHCNTHERWTISLGNRIFHIVSGTKWVCYCYRIVSDKKWRKMNITIVFYVKKFKINQNDCNLRTNDKNGSYFFSWIVIKYIN